MLGYRYISADSSLDPPRSPAHDAFVLISAISTAAWELGGGADPSVSGSIVAAIRWLEGTLLGTIATTAAVISVASVGFMALGGRVDLRRAATIVLGCFILFGASSIVAGLESAVRDQGSSGFASPPIQSVDISPLATLPQHPAGYDPYAGAAVPQ
ncbi:TrbC/VirB2 family protein [Sphingomonas sp. UNC305MFCol5.2]|uniref:TrbC/VirB2 family protein n=1 Tax=Sphingomonas sp. UNC305MFCol5.2 TaxID=1449076 RepID=UPI0009DF83E6